jgi:predicted lipid-binding transport protein (Tim44 family)
MFHRRAKATPYTREQTEHWLTWLAKAMKGHSQSVFYLEWIQPDWLSLQRQQRLVTFVTSVMGGLFGGLFGGLLDGLYYGELFGLRGGLRYGLKDGLTIGEIRIQSLPNEGIRRSVLNALISGLIVVLILVLMGGLFGGLRDGLFFGLLGGLLGGLRFGGRACLHHFALRLVLWHNNFAPFNYVRFLDYAAARIFLHKVGGGYVFVHRMLLEYFVSMHQTSAEQQNCNRNG